MAEEVEAELLPPESEGEGEQTEETEACNGDCLIVLKERASAVVASYKCEACGHEFVCAPEPDFCISCGEEFGGKDLSQLETAGRGH